MTAMASQITSLTIVYSSVFSGADQRKYQSFASLAFVRGIYRWPVNSQHKGPVTRNMFPFDHVIIRCEMVDIFLFKVECIFHLNTASHNAPCSNGIYNTQVYQVLISTVSYFQHIQVAEFFPSWAFTSIYNHFKKKSIPTFSMGF